MGAATSRVYLLTIECVRSDYFDCQWFPKCWNRFSDDFVRFSRAYANGVATPLSFPSILGDEHVSGDGSLTSASRTTLAELFEGTTIGVPNNAHLHPARNYDRGFDTFNPRINPLDHFWLLGSSGYRRRVAYLLRQVIPSLGPSAHPVPYPPADVVSRRVTGTVARMDPQFLWAHFLDPHGPYYPHLLFNGESRGFPQDIDYADLNRRMSNDQSVTHYEHNIVKRLYKEKIRYADRYLEELLSNLEAIGKYEESMIIITADHGNLIGERGSYGHDWDQLPLDELIRVPLVVKYPGNRQCGSIVSHPVQHLDIKHTVAHEFEFGADLNPKGSPLLKTDGRTIISKSNIAARGISANGEVMYRRDGETKSNGSPSEKLVERTKNATIPTVSTDINDDTMSERELKRVKEELSALGYN